MSCSVVRERYSPRVIAANGSYTITGNSVGCFLCTTAGTISLVANAQDGKAAFTLFSALAVTAGTYYKLPFYLSSNGGLFTCAGGAAGVLGV